jgi:brefeldin A-inhibited guanine nucleotide-exchange protein
LISWFAGLSELSFDPRPDIRKSALDILFDTLRIHGHLFSLGLWERVFDSVLFPIFDSVRRAMDHTSLQSLEDDGTVHHENDIEVDAWLYETCTLALQLVVDLFVKFYNVVNPLVGKILQLLTGFIKRSHQSLAAIGVAAFVRMINNAGTLFSDERWTEVLIVLKEAAAETLPDILKVVHNAESQVAQSMHRHGFGIDYSMKEDKTQNFKKGLHAAIIEMKSRTAVQLLLVQVCFLMIDVYYLAVSRHFV